MDFKHHDKNITLITYLKRELKYELIKWKREIGLETIENLAKDAEDFLNDNRDFLSRSIIQLTLGDIDFAKMIHKMKAKKDLATMLALRQQGLTETRLDELKDVLMKILLATIMKVAGGGNLIKVR